MVNIDGYEKLAQKAVVHFWDSRLSASKKQKEKGKSDQGSRSSVTTGKNMDGFVALAKKIIVANGIPEFEVYTDGKTELNLPGYYRPVKNWDLLVVSKKQLIAAIEFKSQVGSFGNNFNNRVEESLGNATDLLTAFREKAFGNSQRPFLGYLFLLEDCPESLQPVRIDSPHFDVFPEFKGGSYASRYTILCQKLVRERLYDAATLLLSSQEDGPAGKFRELSEDTGLKRFFSSLAGKVAGIAAERRK